MSPETEGQQSEFRFGGNGKRKRGDFVIIWNLKIWNLERGVEIWNEIDGRPTTEDRGLEDRGLEDQ